MTGNNKRYVTWPLMAFLLVFPVPIPVVGYDAFDAIWFTIMRSVGAALLALVLVVPFNILANRESGTWIPSSDLGALRFGAFITAIVLMVIMKMALSYSYFHLVPPWLAIMLVAGKWKPATP